LWYDYGRDLKEMSEDQIDKGLTPEPPEKDEGLATGEQPSKRKYHEIPDIFQAIQVLRIEDLADPRVISILVQVLNEKIDRIRVLEAEAGRLESEKESLSIQCARQDERLTVSKGSHGLWAGVGIMGGLLTASSISIVANRPAFIVVLVTGIVLSVLGAIGART
jgi:hypothetical protein